MKKRVLSGIQPSGNLHIGNYYGMIKRVIEQQETSDLFVFIANLHSMTSVSDGPKLKELTLQAAADVLALGIDPKKCHFWVQSDVPEVAELAWILSCVTPFGLMERAHSYKDKVAKGLHPTLGLFNYPVLMAADILINQTEVVPVGKDQKQHVEIARDIAIKFNNQYGEVFTIPEPDIQEAVATVPGIDGQKMSKSYNNTIPIFGDESVVKKAVMGVVTDSKEISDPKEKDCTILQLCKVCMSDKEFKNFSTTFCKGGVGYGDAKKFLLEQIQKTFKPFREKRAYLESHPGEVEKILEEGSKKVRAISLKTLDLARIATGLKY